MSKIKNLLSTLLQNGIVEYDGIIQVADLNEILLALNYTAHIYPGKQFIVLKDSLASKKILPPWKDGTAEQAKLVIQAIANETPFSFEVVEQLIENGWLERKDEKIILTPRAVVQFGEFLIEINPEKFKKCPLCAIVCYGSEKHPECLEEYNSVRLEHAMKKRRIEDMQIKNDF